MSLLRPVEKPTAVEVTATLLLVSPLFFRSTDWHMEGWAPTLFHLGRAIATGVLIAMAGRVHRLLKRPVTYQSTVSELGEAFADLPSSFLAAWLPIRIYWPKECSYNARILSLLSSRVVPDDALFVQAQAQAFRRAAADDRPLEMWIWTYRRMHKRLRHAVLKAIGAQLGTASGATGHERNERQNSLP